MKRMVIAAVLALAASPALAQPTASQIEAGHAVFDKWCGICHAPGPFHGGTAGLQVKYRGEKPAELERRTDLPAEVVKVFVRHGINFMPPFRKTEISDAQLEDLAAYVARNTPR